jgi:hypothetical protein
MPVCQICKKEKSTGEVVRVYTARIAAEDRQHATGASTVVKTTYDNFQEHLYFICANCKLWRDKLVGIWLTVLVTIVALVLLVAGLVNSVDWMIVIALFMWIGWFVAAIFISTDQILETVAHNERNPEDKVKAFNERAYRSLMEQSKSQQ